MPETNVGDIVKLDISLYHGRIGGVVYAYAYIVQSDEAELVLDFAAIEVTKSVNIRIQQNLGKIDLHSKTRINFEPDTGNISVVVYYSLYSASLLSNCHLHGNMYRSDHNENFYYLVFPSRCGQIRFEKSKIFKNSVYNLYNIQNVDHNMKQEIDNGLILARLRT